MLYLFTNIAPVAAPANVQYSATSYSLTFSWDEIACGSRGGSITRYDYMFDSKPGYVHESTRSKEFSSFAACTSHTFNVTGVNSGGTGPYSDVITGTTATVSKCFQMH